METSDSECFESADEDVQSDPETYQVVVDKENNTTKSGSNVKCSKIRNVACIPSNEIAETNTFGANNLEDLKKNVGDEYASSYKNVHQTLSIVENEETTIEEKFPENKDISSAPDSKINSNSNETNLDNTSEVPTKSRLSLKTKLGSKMCIDDTKFEKTPQKEPINPVRKHVQFQSDEKKSPPDQNVKLKLVEDENLWDDEELDWGVEEKLEHVEKQDSLKENSQTSITKSSEMSSYQHANLKSGKQPDNWGGWGSWGVSVLSTATNSVSSITSQLTNAIETGLGVVDPEELAKINREEKKKLEQRVGNELKQDNKCPSENSTSGFGLGNLVKLVENTGTKVISGGLDTLETIGKKTMEVLSEGDPGLKKKRAFLKLDQDKPILSQILREAKERSENENIAARELGRKINNYEILFDNHHGLVHLEALELLSKQCEIKLKNIQTSSCGEQYTEFLETMDQIKELCELPDEDEEEQITILEMKNKLKTAVSEMNVQISYDKMILNWEEIDLWLSTLDSECCDEKKLHERAIETLAQVTSTAMEQFHKTGELLLIKDRRSTADEADSLVQITTTLISLIGVVAAKFSEKLNSKISNSTNKEISELITNVFFEAANSSSYIQDALQLLIPVLQVGAV